MPEKVFKRQFSRVGRGKMRQSCSELQYNNANLIYITALNHRATSIREILHQNGLHIG